ncbi:MAG: hypothetical protein OEW91_14365, partial [Acidimicrobiia bacterium]|nr:hypothetical protein [Acidimicrobiia bacterium]
FEELRLTAIEDRIEADLACGEDALLLPELEGLIGEHPYRERLRGQQMIALYRAGRQAEALAAYRDARTTLGDELGVEPSPELQLIEEQVLMHDTRLSAPAARRSNLPTVLTSFVGRSRELEDIAGLLDASRLVVLTGAGGTGKTRLAVETARTVTDRFRDGVWLVELAPVTNPAFIMTAVGDVFGLRPGEGATIEDVTRRFLFSRDLLMVIDNCEHLIDAAAAAIRDILDAAPGVRVLATSRESLGIQGESILRVPSLAVPDGGQPIEESASVRLFLDRAVSARPGYQPSDEDLEAIAAVCRRIDGIPLGIELAAARLRTISPRELSRRLADSFGILSGSSKATSARQRTLEATIRWSHELLKPDERDVFQRLSVFAGGFDIDAAETVGRGVSMDPLQVVDALDSLVDKSLVMVTHQGEATRYRMLEPMRQYAAQQLADTGETDAIAFAHAHHYASMCARTSPLVHGREQMTAIGAIREDYDNVRLAFARLLEREDRDGYLTMAFDLFLFWVLEGMHLEGIETIVAGLDAEGDAVDPVVAIKAQYVAATLGSEITDPESVAHARAGLELARVHGDPNLIGRMELILGASIRHSTIDPEYLEHLLEGRRLLEAHPAPHWWAPVWESALHNLVYAAYLPREDERLSEHIDAALRGFEEAGDEALYAATLSDSAAVYGQGRDDWVIANSTRAVEILERLGVPYWHGHAVQLLGAIHQSRGDHAEALRHLEASTSELDLCGDVSCWMRSTIAAIVSRVELQSTEGAGRMFHAVLDALPVVPLAELHIPRLLDALAAVLTAEQRDEEAASVLGLALATPFPVETLFPREPLHERLTTQLEGRLGAGRARTLFAEGAAGSVDDLLDKAASWF